MSSKLNFLDEQIHKAIAHVGYIALRAQVLNAAMTDMFALKVVRLDTVDEVTAEGYVNEVRLLKKLQGLPRVIRLVDL